MSAAAQLDELIASLPPGEQRRDAVHLRLLAGHDPRVALDPALGNEIENGAEAVAHAQAARAIATGDLDSARAAVSGRDDPSSLSLRVEIAEIENKLPEAITLQETLTRTHRTASNMLRLAGLRSRAGDYTGAIRDALRLAGDERKLRAAREAAFRTAAQAATDGGEYEELEDVADRWGALSPDRTEPAWAEVFALARQGRHADAVAFVRHRRLEPIEDGNRHLLIGEIYLHGITDGAKRMRSLMELSDTFGRPVELERMFIGGVLRTPGGDRPDDPEVIARFQEAMSTFNERFPDAEGLIKIEVGEKEDPESIVAKLAAAQQADTQEQADAREDAINGVRQGRFPIAFLAGLVGRSTADTIIRNGAHPLAVIDRETYEAEVEAATAALEAAAASWDETALITAAGLPEEHANWLRAALAGSVVGRTVKDSLAEAVARQMGGEQVATMQILPDGTPRIYEEDPDTIARIRALEQTAADVAAGFTVAPDRALGEDRLAKTLVADQLVAPAAAAVSALLVARARQLPLYSDDRVLRAFARAFGLQAFGTIALVDAAQRGNALGHKESFKLRDAIIDLGIWSVPFEPQPYVDYARRMLFDMASCRRPLLSDEVALRADPRILHNGLLLATIADEAPEQLEPWAQAIIDSYRLILETEPVVIGSLLGATMFDPDVADVSETTRARTMKVIAALRSVDSLGPAGSEADPLVGAIRSWLHAAKEDDRSLLLERLIAWVDNENATMLKRMLEEDS